MFRTLLILVLGIVVFVSTPLDAQIFRRSARQSSQTARQTRTQQTQAKYAKQLAQRRQQLAAEQKQKDQANPAARNDANARRQGASQQHARATTQPQPQRLANYYNRRTNQTSRQPIQATTPNPNASPRPDLIGQRSGVSARQAVPIVNQADIARRSTRAPTRSPENLTLNAPMTNGQSSAKSVLSVVVRPSVKPITSSPPSPLTSRPNAASGSNISVPNKPQPMPTTPTPARAQKMTFSILKTDK